MTERIYLGHLDRKLWVTGVPCDYRVQGAEVTVRGLARDGDFWLHFELDRLDHFDAFLLQVVWSVRTFVCLPEGMLKRVRAECSQVGKGMFQG